MDPCGTPVVKVNISVNDHFSKGSSEEPLFLFITGGAGTGKTYTTQTIVAHLTLHTASTPGRSPVQICAPTGTAAKNVGGLTIHKLLKIPINMSKYLSVSAKQLKELRSDFRGCHTLVIDKISMVSDQLLMFISERLSDISGQDMAFGGFNIITVGDFLQLSPVCGKPAVTCTMLWHLFQPVLLEENKRQAGDQSYASLLNRARVGLLSAADIDMLKSRLKCGQYDTTFQPDIIRLLLKLEHVTQYNNKMQASLNHHLYTFTAWHYFSRKDKTPGSTVPSNFIPKRDGSTGGLPHILKVSVGTRVMLTHNLYVKVGLCKWLNGNI